MQLIEQLDTKYHNYTGYGTNNSCGPGIDRRHPQYDRGQAGRVFVPGRRNRTGR